MGRTLLRVAIAAFLLAAIAAFFWFDLHEQLSLAQLQAQREALADAAAAQPVRAVAIYFAVYVLVTALSLPGAAILTLAGGAIFGLGLGVLVVSFASSIGATLAFLAARLLFRDLVQRRFGQRLRAVNRGVARDGAFYLLSLRLVPAFPFWVINLVMALTPIRTWTFYWVSQLGMLPATVVYVNAGTALAAVDSPGDILSPALLGAFVLLALLPLLMRAALGWMQRRRAYAGHRRPRRYDYNLIVVGAGSAGLVSAYIAAAAKAKVALIEKHRMGGDCLNTGCVPSKALIRTAQLLADARDSARYGVRHMSAEHDFAEVMERVQRVVATVEPHDSVERYRALGVECIGGEARIVSPWEVEVDGRRLSARRLVLATGARPTVPPLPGLERIEYLTSDTVWSLRERPARLCVLGGGPIGCELAQAFQRLGCQVTLVQRNARLLPKEDAQASDAVAAGLRRDGVLLLTAHTAERVEGTGAAGTLVCSHEGGEVRVAFDRLLLALGRSPNVEGFGLEALGVRIDERGTVATDGMLRTSVPSILACGDVAGPYQFTHVAAHQAWFATVNALLAPLWSLRADDRVIPWCTFTQPEVARVGLAEHEARAQGIDFELTCYPLDELDRAIADDAREGFIRVLTAPGSDRILGATVVGRHAGELIAGFVLAMKHRIGMNGLLATIHVYPTHMEANKHAAGAWKRAHVSGRALALAARWNRWRRG